MGVLIASRLVVPGSSENQALKASLRGHGIAVGEARQVIAPRSFTVVVAITTDGVVAMPTKSPNGMATSADEDSTNIVGPVIIGIVVISLILCAVGLLCYCASAAKRRKIES